MSSYLQKVRHLRNAIKQHNGLWGSFLQLFRTDELKWGDLVGVDKFGNKYYQNKMYFMGRSRWVYYSDQNHGWDYDASQVPPEWHRWLHYICDEPPTKDTKLVDYKWMIDHKENLTGTKQKYVPYSTTRPKIEAWKPPQNN
jgi:NADH dehydrogenase (ubiquinone) 1 alpha subcomplex subunit 12